MNKIDEYYFNVYKAITIPHESAIQYFYNNYIDGIFSVVKEGKQLVPRLRNPTIGEKNKIILGKSIRGIAMGDPGIVLLPTISFEERQGFFLLFMEGISDLVIKNDVEGDIRNYSTSDEFELKVDLKSMSMVVYMDYYYKRAAFIGQMIEKMYQPLGITERTEIIW